MPLLSSFPASSARWVCLLLVLGGTAQGFTGPADNAGKADELFKSGLTWTQFLAAAQAQRDVWLKTTATVVLPPNLVMRFKRVSSGLRIVVVAEDRCPDSVNALPYVAALAASASVPLRIVDRQLGQPLMNEHRTPDGRSATPTVVLVRDRDDVAAWVERPGIVQRWFLTMATNPESARRFGGRQSWYERDRGRTVVAEIVALSERTAAKR